ncbi:hypothetical protein CDAR_53241 [Caerostris darwini]|uniref:Uncharacterized protein n=1 Tax=Caerostris darwini TaxID=1538125 RepID=A0AAV4RF53_9ARAC|nr:hypothetical protein CDAR_53241 [Caerostris darwini]
MRIFGITFIDTSFQVPQNPLSFRYSKIPYLSGTPKSPSFRYPNLQVPQNPPSFKYHNLQVPQNQVPQNPPSFRYPNP